MTALLVIAKEPRPGRVKTRLTPPFTPREAASLAEASLADTLDAVAAAPAGRRVLVLDGEPGPWLPPGFDVVPQCAGGLDERLADAFARCAGPALLIGMDTPQVTPELLAVDFAGCDAWFGPAEDGGFWALGLARPDPALLRGVPMSTSATGAVQRDRLVAAGLRVRDLPLLRDVDTAADAHAVAALAPGGRFAARLARCGARGWAGGESGRAGGVEAGRMARAEPGRAAGTEPDQWAGTEPGRAAGTEPDQGSGTEPGRAASAEPGQWAGTEPGRAASAEPGQWAGAESGPGFGPGGEFRPDTASASRPAVSR